MYLNDNKKYIKNSLNKNKINHILSPMGSGKTTLFKSLALEYKNEGKKVLILSPYRVTKAEFKEVEDCKNIFQHYPAKIIEIISSKNYTTEDFYSGLINFFSSFDVVLIDETDFLFIQALSNSKENILKNDNDYLNMLQAYVLMFYAILDTGILCISASATELEIPPRVKQKVDEWIKIELIKNRNIINTIYSNIEGKIRLKSIVVYENDTNMKHIDFKVGSIFDIYNRIKQEDNNAKFLIFKTKKYSKMELDALKVLNAKIIVREEKIDKKYNRANKTLNFEKIDGYSGLKVIGLEEDDDDLLRDELFNDTDVIAINTSSSRAVSLINNYSNAIVIILDEYINTSSLQAIGRFRKSDIYAFFIGSKIYSKYKSLNDAILKMNYKLLDYCNEILYVKKSKHKFNEKGRYKGKNKGKNKGKAIGKAISEDTIKMREYINYYLLNEYNNRLSIRDNYKLYKLKCIKKDIKHFSEKKFREKIKLNKGE